MLPHNYFKLILSQKNGGGNSIKVMLLPSILGHSIAIEDVVTVGNVTPDFGEFGTGK